MRHVTIMTLSSAVGLIAVFFVDAITLFYIGLLDDPAQTAAIGRSSYFLGFLISLSIGLMIGSSAVAARRVGAGREEDANQLAVSAMILAFAVSLLVTVGTFIFASPLLQLLNAQGEALQLGTLYLRIVLPSLPFMAVGIVCMGLLRAVGDAKRSMYVTLIGGVMTAILDPIFIFVLDLEIVGAAIVVMLTRSMFAFLGMYYVFGAHKMFKMPDMDGFVDDVKKMATITVPAVLTNLAAPVGAIMIAGAIAQYGDSAIAGIAVVDRLTPLAFGTIFSLSGAVGPIVGQNFGAGKIDRVRQTLVDGIIFTVVYVIIAWAVLYLATESIIALYHAEGDAALMIRLFTTFMAGAFIFNGLLFITNATFNNIGYPFVATLFNWARQTLGVIPFIYFGAKWDGLRGIAIGATLGSIVFGLVAIVVALRLIDRAGQGLEQNKSS